MKIIAYDTHKSDQSKRTNFKYVELDELFRTADVVSLNCPLFPENKGVVNKASISKMKKTAFLLNTARGPLVVDQDLADALNDGVIAGAGLDVLSVEPPPRENPLLTARNCIITPHIAWATLEARSRLMDIAVENLKAFISGKPVNVVNK
jgi:glycerate dehydrogenase